MDFEEMEAEEPVSEPMLAAWHCDAELWRQFRANERFDASVTVAIRMVIVPAILAPLLLTIIWLGAWRGLWTQITGIRTSAVVVVLSGIIFLSGLLLWLYRRNIAAAMRTETGEVTVRLDGFTLNGQRFDWRFGAKGLQWGGDFFRFQSCQRLSVDGIEVLEFICAGTSLTNHGFETETYVDRRVPVPPDRIAEADDVADRLNLRFRSANRDLGV